MKRTNAIALSASMLTLCALSTATLAAPGDGSIRYYLRRGSTSQTGCFEPCLCPIQSPVPLRGTFVLGPITPGDVFDFFQIRDVNWRVPAAGVRYTGAGGYQRSAFIDQQAMELDLMTSNTEAVHFQSDLVPLTNRLPAISIDVSINNMYCYDTVLRIRATPYRSDWDGSGDILVNDIFGYLNGWFSGDMDADYDDSGVLTAGDIFAFLNDWFIGA